MTRDIEVRALSSAALSDRVAAIAAEIAAHDAVVPAGSRTHWEVGGSPPKAAHVSAPSGVISYDPAELTISVGAGTPVCDVAAVLADHGQEVVLEPRDARATVGGTIATGLSGPRRLRYGPIRDTVLQLDFVTGDGRVARAGGPTVKNVTGYDLCRLLVGSLGALAVIVAATVRCRPLPRTSRWFGTDQSPATIASRLYQPSTVMWDGSTTFVLLEGHEGDLEQQRAAAGLEPVQAPRFPVGEHRGRVSVPPERLDSVVDALRHAGSGPLGEYGVGTVHVANDDADALAQARVVAEAHGGWLLRECGAPSLDGWGRAAPQAALHRRIKEAFDPQRRLSPGRVPW